MEIKTLSSISGIPFNDTFESFFDKYEIDEDIECYQFVFCPWGHGTSFDDLNQIKFNSRVVIFNIIDTFTDKNNNADVEKLIEFCANNPEQNFIISCPHLNFQRELNIPNAYFDAYVITNYKERLIHCEKKDITNQWISLNAYPRTHKAVAVCYLLSKDYYKNGLITFNTESPLNVSFDKYRNITKIPTYEMRSDLAKGYVRFKSKDYNILEINKFSREDLNVSYNYNKELAPVYSNIAVEIITGTMFFEKTPVLSEKEIQSIYAKNFPIYINGVGMAREMQKRLDIDIFEDIVDHSYDEIEDHFDRLAAAIDRNEKLLDGSTNIKELWFDNRKRFEDNCNKMDELFFNVEYQQSFNHEKIKKALKHFNVSFK